VCRGSCESKLPVVYLLVINDRFSIPGKTLDQRFMVSLPFASWFHWCSLFGLLEPAQEPLEITSNHGFQGDEPRQRWRPYYDPINVSSSWSDPTVCSPGSPRWDPKVTEAESWYESKHGRFFCWVTRFSILDSWTESSQGVNNWFPRPPWRFTQEDSAGMTARKRGLNRD